MIHANPSTLPKTGTVIIGAGPAGIAIAKELEKSGKSCVILEIGGAPHNHGNPLELFPKTMETNFSMYLNANPFPGFGGTGKIWGKSIVPLQPETFERLPRKPLSGWPIDYEEYKKFLPNALDFLHAIDRSGKQINTQKMWEETTGNLRKNPVWLTGWESMQEWESFQKSVLIHVAFNCKPAGILRKGRKVTGVLIDSKNESWTQPCDQLVLACGGIQNAAVLIKWAEQKTLPIDGADWIGQCFMEHPHLEVFLWGGAPTQTISSDWAAPTKKLLEKINQTAFIFRAAEAMPPEIKDPMEVPAECKALNTVLADAPEGDPRRLRYCDTRLEQWPSRANRVELNRNGSTHIICKLNPTETQAHLAIIQEIAKIASKEGQRVMTTYKTPWQGCHHMGTTRMSNSPQTGVCDKEGRVFGTDNLYCAGSSLFPTSGAANPTLSLIALSIRLGQLLSHA